MAATGAGTLFYHWYFNGSLLVDDPPNIAGSETGTLQINNVTNSQVGTYYAIVTDSIGFSTSANAQLRITGQITVNSVTTKYSPNGETLYVLENVSFPVTFTVNIDWAGHPNGNVRFTTSGGDLAPLTPAGSIATQLIDVGLAGIHVGAQMQVLAVSSDGTASAAKPVQLVVMPIPTFPDVGTQLHAVDANSSFSYSDVGPEAYLAFDFPVETGLEVPESVPIFGGFGLEAKIAPELHLTVKGNHADYSAAVGGPEVENDLPILPGQQKFAFVPTIKASADYDSSAKKWNYGFGIQVAFEPSLTFPFVIVPPGLPGFAKLSGKYSFTGTLGPSFDPLSGSAGGGLEGTGTLGFGADHIANVAGYVTGGGTVTWDFPAEGENTSSYCLYWVAGLSGTLLGFEYKPQALQMTGDYPPGCHAAADIARFAVDFGTPRPYPRDYLTRRGKPGTKRPEGGRSGASPKAARSTTLSTLQSDVFPFSDPSIATAGSNCYAAWVEDNTNRTINNRTMLVFATLNGTNWSTATPVADDGTADFHPQLRAFPDGTAVVAWENEGSVLATNAMLGDMLANLQIATAFYNPASAQWSPVQPLTTDGSLHRSPKVVGPSKTNLMLVWVANPANDIEGSSTNPNQLWFTTWNGSKWSTLQMFATIPYPLLRYDLSYNGTNAYVVMSLDSDNALTNVNAHALFSVAYRNGSWGSLQQLTNDQLPNDNPQMTIDPNGHVVLVWLDGGTMTSVVDFDFADRQEISTNEYSSNLADFKLASGSGRLAVVWAEPSTNNPSDFWTMFYDPVLNVWGGPKQLTEDQGTEGETAVTFFGTNQLVALYDRLGIDTSGNSPEPITNADLYTLVYQLGGDLALATGSLQASPANPSPGPKANLFATVQNLGDYAVSNVLVAFYQGDPARGGTAIGQTNLATLLAPGAAQTVTIPWTVPSTTSALPIYAVVDPNHQFPDIDLSNNELTNLFAEPDLEVQSLTWGQVTNNVLLATATVINQGTISSQPATVSFRLSSATGTNLFSTYIPGLAPGQTLAVYFPWSVSNLVSAVRLYAVIDIGTNAVDFNPQSKSLVVTIEPNLTQVSVVLGPVQYMRSGAVQVGITGLIGQTYTIQVSTNLVNWNVLTTVTLTNVSGQFSDPAATNESPRFYRAVVGVPSTNPPPVLAPISNQAINEQVPLVVTASATDSNMPPGALTFSLEHGARRHDDRSRQRPDQLDADGGAEPVHQLGRRACHRQKHATPQRYHGLHCCGPGSERDPRLPADSQPGRGSTCPAYGHQYGRRAEHPFHLDLSITQRAGRGEHQHQWDHQLDAKCFGHQPHYYGGDRDRPV